MNIASAVLTWRTVAARNATTPVMSSCFLNPWVMFPQLGFLVSGCTLHQRNNVHRTLSHIIHVSQAWNLWPCLCKQLMMQTHFITFQLTFSANPAGWDQIKPSWTQGKVRAQLIFSGRTISGHRMEGTGLVVIYGQSNSLVRVLPGSAAVYLVWLRTRDTCGNTCGSDEPPMATHRNQQPGKTPQNLIFNVVSLENHEFNFRSTTGTWSLLCRFDRMFRNFCSSQKQLFSWGLTLNN